MSTPEPPADDNVSSWANMPLGNIDNVRVAFYAAQFTADGLCIIAVTIFLRGLISTRTMHRNFKICMVNLFSGGAIAAITRFVDINGPFYRVMFFIHDCSVLTTYSSAGIVTVERAYSIAFPKRYDRTGGGDVFVVLLVTLPWIISASEALILHITNLDASLIWVSGNCQIILAGCAYIVLQQINEFKFRTNYTSLAERYQLAQNIRMLPTLRAYMKVCVVEEIVISTAAYFAVFHFMTSSMCFTSSLMTTVKALAIAGVYKELRALLWRGLFGARSDGRRRRLEPISGSLVDIVLPTSTKLVEHAHMSMIKTGSTGSKPMVHRYDNERLSDMPIAKNNATKVCRTGATLRDLRSGVMRGVKGNLLSTRIDVDVYFASLNAHWNR